MDYRHEIKHIISPGDAMAIRANLSAVARLDPHAQKNGCYSIHSLYFDDPADTALQDKLDGVNRRRKFRIRYYNSDLSCIMLECKIKQDGVGCKLQERLTLEETQRILAGDTAWMVTSGRPLLAVLYVEMKVRHLRPRTVVTYWRAPYVYGPGNVRVTIDWNIRTGPPRAFLDPAGLTLPTPDNVILLEVKWDEYLPGVIRQATALRSRTPVAYSKYAACRVYG
ncbi:MAG: polyphosphate polymerase domain-containing protein [Aristaeellaceae bacterium]